MTDFWTPERVKLLRKLRAEGLGPLVISKRFGCTKNMVVGKISRLGLSRLDGNGAVQKPDRQRKRSRAIRSGPVTLPGLPSVTLVTATETTLPAPVVLPQTRKCCWPTSDGKPWTFCGAPSRGRYCDEHERRSRGAHEAA